MKADLLREIGAVFPLRPGSPEKEGEGRFRGGGEGEGGFTSRRRPRLTFLCVYAMIWAYQSRTGDFPADFRGLFDRNPRHCPP